MVAAIEIDDVSKRFRLYREKPTSSLKAAAAQLAARGPRTSGRCATCASRSPRASRSGLIGHNGIGQDHAAQGDRRDPPPDRGHRARCAAGWRRCSSSAPASTRSSPAARTSTSTPRSSGCPAGTPTASTTTSSAFAELQDFMDNQVKFYSSGMLVRLGFAVAVHVDPEILLVDEVLAVGDEAFQAKCLEAIRAFQGEGRTIVLRHPRARHRSGRSATRR